MGLASKKTRFTGVGFESPIDPVGERHRQSEHGEFDIRCLQRMYSVTARGKANCLWPTGDLAARGAALIESGHKVSLEEMADSKWMDSGLCAFGTARE